VAFARRRMNTPCRSVLAVAVFRRPQAGAALHALACLRIAKRRASVHARTRHVDAVARLVGALALRAHAHAHEELAVHAGRWGWLGRRSGRRACRGRRFRRIRRCRGLRRLGGRRRVGCYRRGCRRCSG